MRYHLSGLLTAVAILVGGALAMPWIYTAYTEYLDWQYCYVHPYHEHSWTTNPHGCTPVDSTR